MMDSMEIYLQWTKDRRSASPRPLKEWIAEYPNLGAEFLAWVADEPVQDAISRMADDLAGEAEVRRIGASVLNEVKTKYLASLALPASGEKAISLKGAAEQQGWRLPELADRLGIGRVLMGKLDGRLIQPETIPTPFLARLARTLAVSVEGVKAYLLLPPTLASGASYKADAPPQVGKPETFAEAVRSDRSMTEEQKRAALSEDE